MSCDVTLKVRGCTLLVVEEMWLVKFIILMMMFRSSILFHHKCIHMWHLAFINYWVTYWFLLFFSSFVTTSAMIILYLCLLWRPLRRLAFSVTEKIPKSLHAIHVVESICYHLLSAQLRMPFSTFFTYMRTVLSSLWVTMSKWEIRWILNAFIFL